MYVTQKKVTKLKATIIDQHLKLIKKIVNNHCTFIASVQ